MENELLEYSLSPSTLIRTLNYSNSTHPSGESSNYPPSLSLESELEHDPEDIQSAKDGTKKEVMETLSVACLAIAEVKDSETQTESPSQPSSKSEHSQTFVTSSTLFSEVSTQTDVTQMPTNMLKDEVLVKQNLEVKIGDTSRRRLFENALDGSSRDFNIPSVSLTPAAFSPSQMLTPTKIVLVDHQIETIISREHSPVSSPRRGTMVSWNALLKQKDSGIIANSLAFDPELARIQRKSGFSQSDTLD